MNHPKAIGEASEGIIVAHLLKLGYSVSLPFGNTQKYDLIWDDGHELQRVQVKTGRISGGCVMFPTSARNTINGKRTSYHGHADVFLVYCPGNTMVYRVPVSAQTNASQMQLRLDPPRGAVISTIKWARDYEFPPGSGVV